MNFKNKTVLITGGSGGIGTELCRMLTKEGAKVYSFDIHPPHEEIKGVFFIKTDVTNGREVEESFSKINAQVDILINNAGVMRRGGLLESSEADYDLLFNVNLKSFWLMLKHAQPVLSEKAMIVMMSSRHGVYLPPNPALYGLSKQGVLTLSSLFSNAYPQYDVRVLCPGSTDTPLSREGVAGKALEEKKKIMHSPEFLANKIIEFLKSDKKKLLYDNDTREYYTE